MTESKPRFFRTPRAKPGPAAAALAEALDGRTLAGMDAITAAVARDAADLVDAARRQQDPKLWLQAVARLLALTGQLDDRPAAVPGDDGGGGDDGPDGLADALGSGPSMGDEPEP